MDRRCLDLMTPIGAFGCCTREDTVAHAARAIRESGRGCVPIVEDRHRLRLIGVVTERDVCCGVAADDLRALDVLVEEIMRPSSVCCAADEPIEVARQKPRESGATSLPVVDETGGCCGTISTYALWQ